MHDDAARALWVYKDREVAAAVDTKLCTRSAMERVVSHKVRTPLIRAGFSTPCMCMCTCMCAFSPLSSLSPQVPKRQLPLGGPGIALDIATKTIEGKGSKTHVTENAPRDPKYNAGADCLAKTVIKAKDRGESDKEVGGAVRQVLTTGLWSARAGKLIAVLQLRDREWQPDWAEERCAPFPPHERDKRRAHSAVSPFAQTYIQKRTCPAPPPAPDRKWLPDPALPRLSSSARPPDKEFSKFSGFTTMDARWMDTLKEAP